MDNLQKIITRDGSFSLRSDKYNENFHSSIGAISETKQKFINPSQLQRFKNKSLIVLDICFGLGYNSAYLFNELINQPTALSWYGLEIDKRPLKFSIEAKIFKRILDPKVNNIFHSLYKEGKFKNDFFNCSLMWGDAREEIKKIPKSINFDLIFLDGFSPQKCPEIWSIEFLTQVKKRLSQKGYLITYTSSAAVRKTLKDLGLNIFKIKPKDSNKKLWSNGTIATFNSDKNNSFFEDLSLMEKEHLETKASIPYRDPNSDSSSFEILVRRKNEQLFSNRLNTNLWRKKWVMAKSNSTS